MKKKLKLIALFLLGHVLCDTTWFTIGRWTNVDWQIMYPVIIVVSVVLALYVDRYIH